MVCNGHFLQHVGDVELCMLMGIYGIELRYTRNGRRTEGMDRKDGGFHLAVEFDNAR